MALTPPTQGFLAPCLPRWDVLRRLRSVENRPEWRATDGSSNPSTAMLYPPGGYGAPKNRHGHAGEDVGLPAGTVVFSADNHISVADDIFYERFPDDLKGAAPRIWYEDGAYMVGMKGKAWTGGDFGRVLMQYDDLAGAASNNIEARIRELAEDGIERELAFPNAVLALFHYPDKALRERVFRIYNEYMAELQEKSERTLLRCRPDQLVGSEGHAEHARRAEVVGAQDVPASIESR